MGRRKQNSNAKKVSKATPNKETEPSDHNNNENEDVNSEETNAKNLIPNENSENDENGNENIENENSSNHEDDQSAETNENENLSAQHEINNKEGKGNTNDDDEEEDEEENGNEEEDYVVEAIRDHRLRYRKLQFLLKWKGWPEETNTWEHFESLNCRDLLAEYRNNLLLKTGFDVLSLLPPTQLEAQKNLFKNSPPIVDDKDLDEVGFGLTGKEKSVILKETMESKRQKIIEEKKKKGENVDIENTKLTLTKEILLHPHRNVVQKNKYINKKNKKKQQIFSDTTDESSEPPDESSSPEPELSQESESNRQQENRHKSKHKSDKKTKKSSKKLHKKKKLKKGKTPTAQLTLKELIDSKLLKMFPIPNFEVICPEFQSANPLLSIDDIKVKDGAISYKVKRRALPGEEIPTNVLQTTYPESLCSYLEELLYKKS
ncbi:hypothetical protein TRFO_26028 [Tritrichomonas foetus]|uniref:Chromo domain-containing protein n=1 Tax=Tritrichomonas foetus TaxID=1144522 RepID=A0A1J4K9H9_9EUKA|nr:hypothetical protein TRFO_26028 [Tritrichomonas foetus]|eukprot:OHT06101.1 hypothetical protein TRFO_26028 [Tritrichomonas foetus]